MSDTIDRRRVLQLTATSTVVGLAGCAGNGGTSEPTVALSVTDTESTDGTVTIPNVGIDKPGWLVIHPEASGGGPKGSVTLAEKQLDAGEYTDVSLTLDTLRKGEQTVYAMLHYDDPADGEFTFPSEGDPAVTSGGSPVVKPFSVTVTGGDDSGKMASVKLKDTSFTPMRLSVEPGTTVTWTNRDGYTHDVQSAQFHDTAASWDFYSGELSQGATAEHTFDSEGIYEYYCTIHGKSTMCGVVLVGDVSLDKRLPCEESDGGDSSY